MNGDKGVISKIVPDHEMPVGKDGRPMEVLLNPLGIITRTNPSQIVEAMLGKLAELKGEPIRVEDFDDKGDLTEWAIKELKKHGVSETEDLHLPRHGMKVGGIATGNRFFMKLHHTAESKGQGRGSGAYTSDDAPAKGGDSGCFVYDTPIRVRFPSTLGGTTEGTIKLGEVVENKLSGVEVLTARDGRPNWEYITDWFKFLVTEETVIDVELENGRTLSLTPNHVVYLSDGTSKRAGDLTTDDDLLEVQQDG